jgi:hypothetical protein
MRLATDEDLERHFGAGVFLGPVVCPPNCKPEPEEQHNADADEQDRAPSRTVRV